ncbi:MAG: hypothetical protein RLY16_2900 [Bacteroidota bacterium]|jgi:PAS domain S-box-containing protein
MEASINNTVEFTSHKLTALLHPARTKLPQEIPSKYEQLLAENAKLKLSLAKSKREIVLLKNACHAVHTGSWEIDPQNRSVKWTSQCEQIFETASKFKPTWNNLVHFFKPGENRKIFSALLNDLNCNGVAFDKEFLIITAEKNEKWIRVKGDAKITKGKIKSLSGVFQNIDTAKKTEERLLLQDQQLSLMFDNVQDLMFLLMKDQKKRLKYISVNKAYLTTTGLKQQQVVGRFLDETLPTESAQAILCKFEEAIRTKQKLSWEQSAPFLTGIETGLVNITPLFDEQGVCMGVAGSIHNISQRKKTEAALQQAYLEKTSILESITDGFYAIDKNWTVTYWNKVAEETLNIPRSEIVGHNIWDKFENAVSIKLYSEFHRAISKNIAVQFEEYFIIQKAWIEISAYPSPLGLSVYFKNITDRKNAETKLNEINHALSQKARALSASNAELERFAYVASHDLQEPLRMVSSFLQRLEKKYNPILDEDGKRFIHFAVDGADRMKQLMEDLLNYSKIGSRPLELEPVDMNEVAYTVLNMLEDTIQKTKTKISLIPLPTILAGKSAMIQLLLNLVTNGIKYQKENQVPEITISVERFFNEWLFSVSDNGIGIEEQYKDKIFEVFQRLHNKDEYSGTGIGLSICKKILERHNGKIWMESSVGVGSRFYFSLPAEEQINDQ